MSITLYLCADQKNGIGFHGRPVSSDSMIWEDLYKEAFHIKNGIEMDYRSIERIQTYFKCRPRLGVDNVIFSNVLNPHLELDKESRWVMDETFPEPEFEADHALFIEYEDGARFGKAMDKIVIYRYDKVYPSDLRASLPMYEYELVSIQEIEGTSHKILKETYYRKDVL